MPTRASISKRGKEPIRAEAEPDVTANHAPIQSALEYKSESEEVTEHE